MRTILRFLSITAALAVSSAIATAQEFAQGARRDLLKIETAVLPQGNAIIGGGERLIPPGGRSPWHTTVGPKLLYVLEGIMAIEGLAGKTLTTCGPAPKLCFLSPNSLWFFRNAGQAPLKFVVIGIDPVERPTIHEEVGQVTAISGSRVTLALGDARTSDLANPRREVTITVREPGKVAVGDNVVTVRHNEKEHKAEGLVKLDRRWQ